VPLEEANEVPKPRDARVTVTVAVIVAVAVACLSAPAAAQDAEVTDGLVGWWRFDGLVDGKVPELTGNGNPAELMGACAQDFDPARGVHIPSGREDPVEGYARTGDLPFLRGEPTQLTVTAWVWCDGTGGGDAVFCANRFVLSPNLWEVHCEKKSQKGWRALLPAVQAPSRRWLHLVGVLDEDEITLYRNGQVIEKTGISKPMVGGSADLDFGRGFDALHRQMPGYIREVRLYDRALSADEITALTSARRAAMPQDLPDRGLYRPGRAGETAVPFEQPDCAPFVGDASRRLTLTDGDIAQLSVAGCGLYERIDASVWRDTGGLSVSGEASASAAVRARMMFVGWTRGAQLHSPSLFTRACGAAFEIGTEAAAFDAAVPVPESIESGVVMLAVCDRRDDPATLIGATIELDKLEYAAAAPETGARAGAADEGTATVSSEEGLTLGCNRDGEVATLKSDHAEFAGDDIFPMSGWFVTDFAADNVPIPLRGTASKEGDTLLFSGTSQKLNLKYRMEMLGSKPYLDCHAHLQDLSGQDRALMLEFRLPLSSEQAWTWYDEQYKPRAVEPGQRYQLLSGRVTPGGQRKVSAYPFAVLSGREGSLSVAVPLLDEPRLFRLFAEKSFVGGAVLGAQFEVGLSPVTKHFPSSASYRFVIYAAQPTWAFRRTVAKYYEAFPEQFAGVVKRHGNWSVLRMTQQYTPNMADFAVVVDEAPCRMYGIIADHVLGIRSCPYLRPGTWSQLFEGSRSDEDAYEKRMALLAEEEKMPEHAYAFSSSYRGSSLPLMVRATRNSALRDREGRDIWGYYVTNRLDPGYYHTRNSQYLSYEVPQPNWAQVITRQYTLLDDWTREAGAPLGGAYVDNIVGYSINPFDFRRDHWELARFPLVVNADPPEPAQSKVLQLCEFFPRFAEEVHRRGGLLIANFYDADAFVIAQYFDFIGVEAYKGARIERLRVMAGPKPASYLPTEPVTRDLFDNCLSYGVAPGMVRTSGRELYREFMPLIVALSEAGWQPVPHAHYTRRSGFQPDTVVERFGTFDAGNMSFTVRHLAQDGPEGVLSVHAPAVDIPDREIVVVDLRRNEMIEPRWDGDRLIVPLPTEIGRTEVVRVCRAAAWERELVLRVSGALERAGREWAWVKAQHDDTLTARLGFEEDKGRWVREGFEGAKVGLSAEAHSGRFALCIESQRATDGTVKLEPFVIRTDASHRLTFQYRAEGTGAVKARAVFLSGWWGNYPVGETALPDLSLDGAWGDGWQILEAKLERLKGALQVHLQLDFASFAGRFSLDSFSLCPIFEPLAEVPEFGFAELCGKLRAAVESGEEAQAAALIEQVQAQLEPWKAAASRLPEGDAERMAAEIAVVEASL